MVNKRQPNKRKQIGEIIREIHGNDPRINAMIEEEKDKSKASRLIYEARVKACLSQEQLAELARTSQSQIARLEDGDYDGHTVKTMEKIARALNMRYVQTFEPIK
jgi:ribosome-binding protein aMBF1 (putative translation factor)